MPIYEFKCDKCEEVTEMTMKFSDPNPETCPNCSEGSLKKLISSSSFQLKGGGWYSDSYNSKSNGLPNCSSQDSGSSACNSCPASN